MDFLTFPEETLAILALPLAPASGTKHALASVPSTLDGRNPNHQLISVCFVIIYRVSTCFNHPFGDAG